MVETADIGTSAENLEITQQQRAMLNPAPAAAVEDDGSPGGPTDKSQQPTWDKARQEADQRRANERKAEQTERSRLIDQLESERSERQALLAERDQLRDSLNKPQKADDGLDTEITGDTDWEKVVGTVKTLSTAVRDLRKENAQYKSDLGRLAKSQIAREDREAYHGILSTLSSEFGSQLQNEAINIAGTELARRGYSKDNPPSIDTTEAYLRLAYIAAKGKSKSTTKDDHLTLDTASGGGAVQPTLGDFKNLEDAADDMAKHGRFK